MDDQVADDVVRSASLDGLKRTFFLGPHARRVSFASQQNRILNLVWALKIKEILPEKSAKIAVVGGGLTGVMATVVLAHLNHHVVLFEGRTEVLLRQAYTRHRFIHPTVNLWPNPKFTYEPTTALPYFNWHADICKDLIKALKVEWDYWEKKGRIRRQDGRITVVPERTIAGINENDRRKTVTIKPLNSIALGKLLQTEYDLALITTGFADEMRSDIARQTMPYWQNDNLEDLRAVPNTTFVVSGCGDGGLIDALRLAHTSFGDGRLIIDTMHALDAAEWPFAADIAKAEDDVGDARNFDDLVKQGSEDLQKIYLKAVSKLPAKIRNGLTESLVKMPGLVKLVCEERYPYSPNAAPIHKLLLAHAEDSRTIEIVHGHLIPTGERTGKVMPVPYTPPPTDAPPPAAGAPDLSSPITGVMVVRNGAKANFADLVEGKKTQVAKLISTQRLEAANLDLPFWRTAEDKLISWPPASTDPLFSDHLTVRLPKVQHFLKPVLTAIRARVGIHHDRFRLIYRESNIRDGDPASEAENWKRLNSVPEELFGFTIEKWPEDQQPSAEPIAQHSGFGIFGRNKGAPLYPGGQIAGGSKGRLGPYVRDEEGRIFFLTARHVLERISFKNAGSDGDAFASVIDSAQYIISEHPHSPEGERDNIEAEIAVCELRPRNDGVRYESQPAFAGIADRQACFGETCHLIVDGGRRSDGKIVSTDASPLYYRPGSNTPLLLSGAIEIQAIDDDVFSRGGDSGAPVVLADGQLLGLLVGGRDNLSYVVPVLSFMRRHGLEIASNKDIQKAQVNQRSGGERSGGDLKNSLGWGLAAMKTDYQSEMFTLGAPPTRDRK